MSPSFEQQVALVSGGGSGIGKEIARALANAGAAVAISGRRPEVLEAAVDELAAHGARVIAVAGDVALAADADRMVAETVAVFGGLDILVNNAGLARNGPLEAMEPALVDAMIDVDLKGPIHLTRAALPHLRRRRDAGGAAVLNVSSSVTVHPVPNFSVYSAAKAGLETLTRCWALDFAGDRIRVNAIAPGVVETPLFDTMMPAEAIPGALAYFAAATPLGRVGQPQEVAALALFLLGPDAGWLTGAVIPLDGGLSLGGSA